jgi:hypothetical protein
MWLILVLGRSFSSDWLILFSAVRAYLRSLTHFRHVSSARSHVIWLSYVTRLLPRQLDLFSRHLTQLCDSFLATSAWLILTSSLTWVGYSLPRLYENNPMFVWTFLCPALLGFPSVGPKNSWFRSCHIFMRRSHVCVDFPFFGLSGFRQSDLRTHGFVLCLFGISFSWFVTKSWFASYV